MKNMNLINIESIEKMVLDDCNCKNCSMSGYLKSVLSSIKTKKEDTIQLDELTLTGKMIIKIKMEIVKKHLLETFSDI
jgi:hypothetical protein